MAMRYSQVEGVDYVETFSPTASPTCNRFVTGYGMKVGPGPDALRCTPGVDSVGV